METNTKQYEYTYGHKPKGQGMWGLKLTGTDNQGRYTTETYFESGKLAEAKKKAIARMKSEIGGVKKVTEIEVLT